MACERSHTHLIVFTHACGYYSRAATISLVDLQVRLLFEGGYYSGCGFYSSKYGIMITTVRLYTSLSTFEYVHS